MSFNAFHSSQNHQTLHMRVNVPRIIRIASDNGTSVEIGRQNKRLGDDPLHHGHGLALPAGYQFAALHMVHPWIKLIREIPVQIHVIGVLPARVVLQGIAVALLKQKPNKAHRCITILLLQKESM